MVRVDLDSIRNIVAQAEAYILKIKGMTKKTTDVNAAKEFFRLSASRYMDAFDSNSKNKVGSCSSMHWAKDMVGDCAFVWPSLYGVMPS